MVNCEAHESRVGPEDQQRVITRNLSFSKFAMVVYYLSVVPAQQFLSRKLICYLELLAIPNLYATIAKYSL